MYSLCSSNSTSCSIMATIFPLTEILSQIPGICICTCGALTHTQRIGSEDQNGSSPVRFA